MAFNNKGYAFGTGQGVKKDETKRTALYVETFNRIVQCCSVRIARYLLEIEHKHDRKTLRRVVRELLQWAAALDAKNARGAQKYLDELYAKNILSKPASPFSKATLKDEPP